MPPDDEFQILLAAEGCKHEADAAVIRIIRLVLRNLFLGRFLERLVDVRCLLVVELVELLCECLRPQACVCTYRDHDSDDDGFIEATLKHS